MLMASAGFMQERHLQSVKRGSKQIIAASCIFHALLCITDKQNKKNLAELSPQRE